MTVPALLLLLVLALGAGCGQALQAPKANRQRIAIVADVSASVKASSELNPAMVRQALKHALRSYVPARPGHQLSLYECATHAKLLLDWTDIADRAAADAAIDAMDFDLPYEESFTNWEACLRIVGVKAQEMDHAQPPRNVYFITDGDPTTYVDQPGEPPSDDLQMNLQRAMDAARTLKDNGVTVTPIGIGPRVTPANLAAIAGPCGYSCWQNWDYFHVPDFKHLRHGVRDGLIVRDDGGVRDAKAREANSAMSSRRSNNNDDDDGWLLTSMDGIVLQSSGSTYQHALGMRLADVVGAAAANWSSAMAPGEPRTFRHEGQYRVRHVAVRLPGDVGGIVGIRTQLAPRLTCGQCAEEACTSVACDVECVGFCLDPWKQGLPEAELCAAKEDWQAMRSCLCAVGTCDGDCRVECAAKPSPSPLPTPAPTPAAAPETKTEAEVVVAAATVVCRVHVWEDANGNGVQDSESNLQGVGVSVAPATSPLEVYSGATDATGVAVLPAIATARDELLVLVAVPADYTMSTPAQNPFPVAGDCRGVPSVGLQKRSRHVDISPPPASSIGAGDIVAMSIAGGVLLLLLIILCRGIVTTIPSPAPRQRQHHHHELKEVVTSSPAAAEPHHHHHQGMSGVLTLRGN